MKKVKYGYIFIRKKIPKKKWSEDIILKKPYFFKKIEIQIEKLLDAPDEKTFIGLRDKTMIETLYSCGLRISELVNLEIIHVNFQFII